MPYSDLSVPLRSQAGTRDRDDGGDADDQKSEDSSHCPPPLAQSIAPSYLKRTWAFRLGCAFYEAADESQTNPS